MSNNKKEERQKTSLDPLQMTEALLQMGQMVQNFFLNHRSPPSAFSFGIENIFDPMLGAQLYSETLTKLLSNPKKMAEATQDYMNDMQNLTKQALETFTTSVPLAESIIMPLSNDRRFKDHLWQENPYFNYLKQSYLLWNRWMRRVSQSVEGLDKKTAYKLDFFTRQFTDFFSPNNFIWTNPRVLQDILDSQGKSIVQGMKNFLRDIEEGEGELTIKMVDRDAFKLGENLATTPGDVIFQNSLIQLIRYTPTTPSVYQIPLLVVPPCINKFYIFDLRKDNSFIRWCVNHGIQVFIISWVNPNEELASKSFEDYVFEGVGEAVRVIQGITHYSYLNALGFCIGGNILSCFAAAQMSQNKSVFKSLTYFATLFDFSEPGDLGIFIDEAFLDDLEERIKCKGFMEGKDLARTFNLLRANDLIWSFIINNYLLGKEPAAFDLLYWNSDSTNLPWLMYIYYLREMFLKNNLFKSHGLNMRGQPISLSNIKTPSYILNTHEDHIAPWHCGYAGISLFQGPKRFVLGGSGHIAGVFNHPDANKYRYWTGETYNPDPHIWLEQAEQHSGSWWNDWKEWLNPFLGEKVPEDSVLSYDFLPFEKAPGSYATGKGNLSRHPSV